MLIIEKFYERDFKAKKAKNAYMKACRFVAANVMSKGSKVEASKVVWDIKRENEDSDDLPTFRLTLYYKFDDKEHMERTCNSCKEFHKSFFINENYNCSRCNKVGYQKSIREKLSIATEYFRKVLDDELTKL